MTRLCWILVVLVVVVDGRPPHICEQKEHSLAGLDQAKDALKKAKDLYPDCEDENKVSNSSECSKKSLGFIDVALDLVTNAKNNFPECPPLVVKKEKCSPMDCQDLLASGHTESGVYSVWPRSRIIRGKAVQVRCDMDRDGGGWTVIQRRGNFSKQENFEMDWKDYKNGFGSPEKDFWLGNDNIFALSNQGAYSLRMDMTAAEGESAYAVFREFWIGDENSNYRLHVDKYEGNAGDSLSGHNGQMFTTKDRDNDKWADGNCAVQRKGGFWYKSCASCNPNSRYNPGVKDATSVIYYSFKKEVGLFSMEMKLKRL